MDGVNIADERKRFSALIQQEVQNNWYIPPGNEDRVVRLRLEILPTGELRSVELVEGSGSQQLDESAMSAVRRVDSFPTPDDSALFDELFRGGITVEFSPEE